jgi:hypothetical protein
VPFGMALTVDGIVRGKGKPRNHAEMDALFDRFLSERSAGYRRAGQRPLVGR